MPLAAPALRAASCPELCDQAGADPCVVTGTRQCDSPAKFDLGTRALLVKRGASIQISGGDGNGTFGVIAGAVTFERDVKLKAQGTAGESGAVTLTASGPVLLSGPGAGDPGSLIEVSAELDGGVIAIKSASGDVQALGFLEAKSGKGEGGEVDVTAMNGGIAVGGDGINVSGSGGFFSGGSIDLDATGGSVSIAAPLDIRGGDGGEINVTATGDVAATPDGEVLARAADGEGAGGSVQVDAGGTIRIGGKIDATAAGGGYGGDVFFLAETGSVEITARVDLTGAGDFGAGGLVFIDAGEDLTITQPLVVSGGDFGGEATMAADRFVTVAATGGIDGRGADAGGSLLALSGESLDVLGTIQMDGTSRTGSGGRTTLRSCTLRVLQSATVSSTGTGTPPNASNLLQASGQMTVSGKLLAGEDGRNRLEYRSAPPVLGAATITPAADQVQNAALPCCGDQCLPPTTTTTTTLAPSTSTTSPASSTTTSTTTSTTAPDSSTTTTTASTSSSTTEAPTTSSTTTSIGTTTTTSVTVTTSTTSVASPTTSTTGPPRSCLDGAVDGFDGVGCYLGTLSALLDSTSSDAVGGARSANELRARLKRADRFLIAARDKAKPWPTLRRARKQFTSLRVMTQRGLKRGRIDRVVGDELLALSTGATNTIDRLRDALR